MHGATFNLGSLREAILVNDRFNFKNTEITKHRIIEGGEISQLDVDNIIDNFCLSKEDIFSNKLKETKRVIDTVSDNKVFFVISNGRSGTMSINTLLGKFEN
jgi:hypothetical protein